ncbi:MAG: thioesterase family protein, partial [Candidatus Nanopelagicales bacterium]
MSSIAAHLAFAVSAADTATALGSGDVPVLATPRLIAWLEAATVDACPPLGSDETSVGTRVEVEHLAASPVGASV